MITHVVNTFQATDPSTAARNQRARLTWDNLALRYSQIGAYKQCFGTSYGRSSLDIGDKRSVPFMKDVISSGLGSDIVLLTNADTCLVQETVDILTDKFLDPAVNGVWSSRLDMDKPMRSQLTQQQAIDRGSAHAGADVFAFRSSWWKTVCDEWPDTLLGYEGWDAVVILALGAAGNLPNICYHEQHDGAYWYKYRMVSRGNLWNRSVIRRWLDSTGKFGEAVKIWRGVAGYRVLPEHKI